MYIRTKTARCVGKLTKGILNKFGSDGSSLPGKMACKIDPYLLKNISKDYRIILVTGTNGKTLTTALITEILRMRYKNVITNATGANMYQGIVTEFIMSDIKVADEKFAVIEVDEATLKHVTKDVEPELIVFTNIFPDQVDRFGGVLGALSEIQKGASLASKATIIANGDLMLFHSLNLDNPVVYYGFAKEVDCNETLTQQNNKEELCPNCKQPIKYHSKTYGSLGDYYCDFCEFKRRNLSCCVTEIVSLSAQSSIFKINGVDINLPFAGVYNIYNALAAFTVGDYFDFAPNVIAKAIERIRPIAGRQEKLSIGNHEVVLNLIKNTVGFNQVVDMVSLDKDSFSLVILLNNKPADGTDISWINESNFEKILSRTDGKPVVLSGMRIDALVDRMKKAGLKSTDYLSEPDFERLDQIIQNLSTPKVHVLATFTALADLRKILIKQSYIAK